jgi:hypothetical protein
MIEFDNPSGGFPMKRFLKVIPFLLLAILAAVPVYSQTASSERESDGQGRHAGR